MATPSERPLVSVVTPVYNTAEYLDQCIKSVLSQTYANLECVILDNCSTDSSLEIAQGYAKEDTRVRVVSNSEFLNQRQNYNEALRHISEESRYCKIVQADDWLYPACVEEMVAVAESDPSVGIVGACTLLDFGTHANVYLMGLPFSETPHNGREVCRRFLLEGLYVFGSPTATMFRTDIVRSRRSFYNADSVIIDTAVCLEVLQDWNFGFVYQVLTYTRRYNDSFMSILKHYDFMTLTEFICLHKYGREFLSEEEFARRRAQLEREYHLAVGESVLRRRPKEYWDFQSYALEEIGVTISRRDKSLWALGAAVDLALNPKQTVKRLLNYRREHLQTSKVGDYVDV